MSYAQVAQHHKEFNSQKEKQQKTIEKQSSDHNAAPNSKTGITAVNNASVGSGRIQGESRDSRGKSIYVFMSIISILLYVMFLMVVIILTDGSQQRESSGPTQPRHGGNGNSGSGGARNNGVRSGYDRSQRRRPEARTSQLRDFVATSRSPK